MIQFCVGERRLGRRKVVVRPALAATPGIP
jgi:hypothetical protein